MKKIFCSLALLAFTANAALAGEVFDLNVASVQPAKHFYTDQMEADAQAISDATNDEVNLHYFPSGTLIKQSEMFPAVAKGGADFVVTSFGDVFTQVPMLNVSTMPFTFTNDLETNVKIFEAIIKDPAVKDEMAKVSGNAELIHVAISAPAAFLTKGAPVRSPKDVAGKRWLTFTPTASEEILSWGGTPVQVTGADLYVSFQRGMGEGCYVNTPAIVAAKLDELAKSCTVMPTQYVPMFMLAARETWNLLNEDQKAAVMKNLGGHDNSVKYTGGIGAMGQNGLNILKKKNIPVYELSADELQAFMTPCLERVSPKFIDIITKNTALSQEEAQNWLKHVIELKDQVAK